jgi:endonuclease YncB( thermonuclease family)
MVEVMLKHVASVVALLVLVGQARAADITGVPRIQSGNLVTIGNAHLRLAEIAAPNLQQLCLDAAGTHWACGLKARDELARHAGKRSWTCHAVGRDRHNHTLATCTVDGEDIQQWMVKDGWALPIDRHGHAYDADQKAAQAAKAGIWRGAFIAPWDWRVRKKNAHILGPVKHLPRNARRILLASASGSVPPSPACRIKGNVNMSGHCIYHRPSSRWYAQIRMKISKGTRWFCSVEDAEAAGCRETRR